MIIDEANRLVEEIAKWFEEQFQCRAEYADEAELVLHLKQELPEWTKEKYPDWVLQGGRRNYMSLFGWTLHTDLELHNQKTDQAIPIEIKLTKKDFEYGTLHAVGQTIYYSTKGERALALVVDQGRATRDRTPEEKALQDDLWTRFGVKLSVRKH